MTEKPSPKQIYSYKYLTKSEQKDFIESGGLENLPECYSCKSTKDTIWQVRVQDNDGNVYHTCPTCLDCYTLDIGLENTILGNDGECILDFSFRKNCTPIKALNCHCKECGKFMMTFGRIKYCCNDCKEIGESRKNK